MNSVFALYHELSKPRVCVICLSLRLRQITQTSVLIIVIQGATVDSETAHFIQECHQVIAPCDLLSAVDQGVDESELVRARRVKFQERVHASVPQTTRKEAAEEEQYLIVQVAVFCETGATLSRVLVRVYHGLFVVRIFHFLWQLCFRCCWCCSIFFFRLLFLLYVSSIFSLSASCCVSFFSSSCSLFCFFFFSWLFRVFFFLLSAQLGAQSQLMAVAVSFALYALLRH